MRITVNGRFTGMSTLRKVPANLWDSKKERAIGKGPIPIEINRHLESLHIDTRQACKRREVYIFFHYSIRYGGNLRYPIYLLQT